MAPRQRISPQAPAQNINELAAAAAAAAGRTAAAAAAAGRTATETSSETRPLVPSNKINSNKAESAETVLWSEVARERHDYFNLVVLLLMVVAAAMDWDFQLLFQGYGPDDAFLGTNFLFSWRTCVAYFIADLIWVACIPHCVKSPKELICHHLVVLIYLMGPLYLPKYRWFMGGCLSIEINTWFLILRRVVYKKKWYWVEDLVSFMFYASWISIRLIVYPIILVKFLFITQDLNETTGHWFHPEILFITCHFVLCCLNLKWSWDSLYPIIKSWSVKDAGKPTIANGL